MNTHKEEEFQNVELTQKDKISVVLYRGSYLFFQISLFAAPFLAFFLKPAQAGNELWQNLLGFALLVNILAMAVALVNIHLYSSTIKRRAQWVFMLGMVLVGVSLGTRTEGTAVLEAILNSWLSFFGLALLFGISAFIAAKEYFCFRFPSAPVYIVSLCGLGLLWLVEKLIDIPDVFLLFAMLIAGSSGSMLALAKTRQDLAKDIGDKSAYR